MDLKELGEIAIKAAKEASQAILKIYNTDFETERKADQSPVTLADKTSSNIISAALIQTGIMVISEEEKIPAYEERKDEEYVWLVDPLDGTKEFVRKNGEFCICIALIKNQQPILGMIYSPTDNIGVIGGMQTGVYHFNFATETHFNASNRIAPLADATVRTIAFSRSHPNERMKKMISVFEEDFGTVSLLKKGSALKFIDLALGRADFYPRFAPTMEWDIAAGQAIYEAIGGEIINIANFKPLKYNKESLFNPSFIAKNVELDISKIWKKK